jgi:hypothetical protein
MVGAPGDVNDVYVLFLNADGTVRTHQRVVGPASDFGVACAGVGDLNGDGTPDSAIGAPFDDDGGVNRGAVWILLLQPDGTELSRFKISDLAGGFEGILQNNARFGSSVTCLGDLDGDLVVDLAVGALGQNFFAGSMWVLFLNQDGTVREELEIGEGTGGFSGELDVDSFGHSVGLIGDLNQDGTVDLLVGAPGDDDQYETSGAIYTLFLQGESMIGIPGLSPTPELDVWPNPSRSLGELLVAFPSSDPVIVSLFDIEGRLRARELVPVQAGEFQRVWSTGREVAPGTYFLRVEQGRAIRTAKVVVR